MYLICFKLQTIEVVCYFSLPTYSSDKIQHLDTVSLKRLKEYLSRMSVHWHINHSEIPNTQYQITETFGKADKKTATMGKWINSFRIWRIFLGKRNVFSEDNFLTSSVIDQPMPADITTQSTSECEFLSIVTRIIPPASDKLVTEQMSTKYRVAVTDQSASLMKESLSYLW